MKNNNISIVAYIIIGLALSILIVTKQVSFQQEIDFNDVNTFDTFDTLSNKMKKGIGFSSMPAHIVVDSLTKKMYVYVVNYNFSEAAATSSIYIINASSNEKIDTIPIGKQDFVEYMDIDISTNKIYLANSNEPIVSVIDIKNPNRTAYNITLTGDIRGLDVNSNNSLLYVAVDSKDKKNNPYGEISVIDGKTNNITNISLKLNHSNVRADANTNPDTVVVVPDTNMVYAPILFSNTVAVIDGENNKEITPIIVSESNWFDIDVNNKNNSIYLVNDDSDRIYVIDSSSNSIIKTITGNRSGEIQSISKRDLPDTPRTSIAINPNTEMIYMARFESDTKEDPSNKIVVIDAKTNKILKSIDVNIAPTDIAINPLTNMVYFLGDNKNPISIIDGNTNNIILGKEIVINNKGNISKTTVGLKTGFNPFEVEINPSTNTIYVLYERSNSISIINGNNDTYVDKIFYNSNPNDIAINPERNLVYITYPSSNITAVINGETNKLIGNISEIKNPLSISINLSNNTLYLTNQSENIFFIDGYTNKHTFTLPVKIIPTDIEIDESLDKIFVSYFSNNEDNIQSILVIDKENKHGRTIYNTYNIPIGRSDGELLLSSNQQTNILYAAYNEYIGGPVVSVIDSYANRIMKNITIDNNLLNPTNLYFMNIIVNSERNLVYLLTINLLNDYYGVVLVIDGNTNNIIANETLGIYPTNIDINPVTDTVYITNTDSNTLSIIDGKEHKATVGVNFMISPSYAGEIYCDNNKVTNSYIRYPIGIKIECEARSNSGYEFSSWSGDYDIEPKNSHLYNLNFDKYGKLNANFIIPSQMSIPTEFWAPLYGLIPGFFIPSIISYLNGRRQRGYLKQYREIIDNTYNKYRNDKDSCIRELESIKLIIMRLYEDGKISESHQDNLNKRISDYESILL